MSNINWDDVADNKDHKLSLNYMNLNLLLLYISEAHQAIAERQFLKAAELCRNVLASEPMASEAWYNLGLAHVGLNEKTSAIIAFRQASQTAPASAEAQCNIGLEFIKLNSEHEAEACLNRAHNLNPRDPNPFCNLALLRRNQNRFEEAASLIIKAIQLAPNTAVLYTNLGGVLTRLHMYEDAIAACERATQIDPKCADAWNNLAVAYTGAKQYKKSVFASEIAYEINPNIKWLLGNIIYSKLKICDWTSLKQHSLLALSEIVSGNAVIEPGVTLSISDDGKLQKKCAEIYASDYLQRPKTQTSIYKHNRIRIGYVSSDFRNHAVSFLATGLFENHNKEIFETHGFDTSKPDNSTYKERIHQAFETVHNVYATSIDGLIDLIKKCEIDILIDLNGYTVGSITDVFAARPAPIQLNFIGYPGTTGSQFMDYIIADRFTIPEELKHNYSEKIIWLPDCFQPNDNKKLVAEKKPRCAYGLTKNDFVFACFNQTSKITPEIFSSWLFILSAVPSGKLWVAIPNNDARDNLLTRVVHAGISPNRIIFAEYVEYPEHLMRHTHVDLMLDTFPFSGGTTTSDALWSGVPVLTIEGQTFASRMASSLLNCASLPELVATSIDEYQAIAINLATDVNALKAIRCRLKCNIRNSALYDVKRYTKHFEQGLMIAMDSQRRGLPPDDISVDKF